MNAQPLIANLLWDRSEAHHLATLRGLRGPLMPSECGNA